MSKSLNLTVTKIKNEDRKERQIGLYRGKSRKEATKKVKTKLGKKKGRKGNVILVVSCMFKMQTSNHVLCRIQSNICKLTSESNVRDQQFWKSNKMNWSWDTAVISRSNRRIDAKEHTQ
jgi:hypothetical protein